MAYLPPRWRAAARAWRSFFRSWWRFTKSGMRSCPADSPPRSSSTSLMLCRGGELSFRPCELARPTRWRNWGGRVRSKSRGSGVRPLGRRVWSVP